MKNIDNKIATIKENFSQVEGSITIREYVENERSADPGFMRYLLDNEDISDFGVNMTDKEEGEWQMFLNMIS